VGVSLHLGRGGLRPRHTRGRGLRDALHGLQRPRRQRRRDTRKNRASSPTPRHKSRRGGPRRDPKKRPAPEKLSSSRPSIRQPIQLGQMKNKNRKIL